MIAEFNLTSGSSNKMSINIFTADGNNVKVKVAVKFIDNQTKATQVSQYELTLHKDSNWKIIQ